MKPILYMMVGCPGSGKSTFAQKYLLNADYISRDLVRLSIIKEHEAYFSHEDEVYDEFVTRLADSLRRGRDVVADATHLSRGSRSKLVQALARKGLKQEEYDIINVVLDTKIEVCIARDSLRPGPVTEPVIRNMLRSYNIPKVGEFMNTKEVWIINES